MRGFFVTPYDKNVARMQRQRDSLTDHQRRQALDKYVARGRREDGLYADWYTRAGVPFLGLMIILTSGSALLIGLIGLVSGVKPPSHQPLYDPGAVAISTVATLLGYLLIRWQLRIRAQVATAYLAVKTEQGERSKRRSEGYMTSPWQLVKQHTRQELRNELRVCYAIASALSLISVTFVAMMMTGSGSGSVNDATVGAVVSNPRLFIGLGLGIAYLLAFVGGAFVFALVFLPSQIRALKHALLLKDGISPGRA